MNFEEFSRDLTVIVGEKADQLRASYIAHFVEVSSDYYQKNVATKVPLDGETYYFGYLWDCLKSRNPISDQNLIAKLREKQQELFVFLDLHSSKKILIKDYWKFPVRAVLAARSETIILGMSYLPQDIYIFDASLEWSLIFTHEQIDNQRWCLEAKGV